MACPSNCGTRLLHRCCSRHASSARCSCLLLSGHSLLLLCQSCCACYLATHRCLLLLHHTNSACCHCLLLHRPSHLRQLLCCHNPRGSAASLLHHCHIGQGGPGLGSLLSGCRCLLGHGLLCCNASSSCACLRRPCPSCCLLQHSVSSNLLHSRINSQYGSLGFALASNRSGLLLSRHDGCLVGSSTSNLLRCGCCLLTSSGIRDLLRCCLPATCNANHLAGGHTCSLLSSPSSLAGSTCCRPSSLLHRPCCLDCLSCSNCALSCSCTLSCSGGTSCTGTRLPNCRRCLLLSSDCSRRFFLRGRSFLRCCGLLRRDDIAGGTVRLLRLRRLALRRRICGLPLADGRAGCAGLGGWRGFGELHGSRLAPEPAQAGGVQAGGVQAGVHHAAGGEDRVPGSGECVALAWQGGAQ